MQDLNKLQNNKCTLSGKIFDNKNSIALDHCHDTEIVRGIIKRKYNIGLGCYYHSIEWIRNAIEYLEKHK